jgi:hypothetical protein
MSANCTTPLSAPKPRRRWPLKKDYVYIDRAEAVLIVTYYGDLFDLDSLRKHSNFRNLVFSKAGHFDNIDLGQAIRIAMASVVENHGKAGMKMLRDQIESHFGSLDGPVAINVCGWPALYLPGVHLH